MPHFVNKKLDKDICISFHPQDGCGTGFESASVMHKEAQNWITAYYPDSGKWVEQADEYGAVCSTQSNNIMPLDQT